MTRVLNIITRLEQGGAPVALLETIRRLPEAEFEVHLATGVSEDPHREMKVDMRREGFRLISIPSLRRSVHPLRDLCALWKLIRVIRAGRYDLVHTHTSKAGFLGRLAAWLCGVQSVAHSPHGTILEGYFRSSVTDLFTLLERLAAPLTRRIICLTAMEIDQYLGVRIGRRNRYTYIYNGIDIQAYGARTADPSRLREALKLPLDATVCITVGRLVPVKGHCDLLQALPQIRDPGVILVFAGDGELRTDLESLASRLGVAERVRFLGWREDTAELLGMADLFVLPSHNEGLGLVLIEAMAKRLPVVATSVGGVPEVVAEGKTGLLVPPHAPEALARAVGELVGDPDLRRRMGEAGYRRAVERFSIDATARQTSDVYRELIGADS